MVAAFSLVLFVLNIPLIKGVGWRGLWYYQVVYPPHYLAYWFGTWFPGLPEPLAWHTLPRLAPYLLVYAVPPVVYPTVLWYCWRNRRNAALPLAELLLLASTGLFLVLEILPGVNWLRVYCVAMPGLILLVWAATRVAGRRTCVVVAGWLVVVCMAIGNSWSRHSHTQTAVALPAGKAILPEQKADKFLWLAQHTRPGEFFFQPAWPESYVPLGLRNPTFVDSLIANEETRPEFVGLAIQQIDRRQVKYILWSRRLNAPNDPARPPLKPGKIKPSPRQMSSLCRARQPDDVPGRGAVQSRRLRAGLEALEVVHRYGVRRTRGIPALRHWTPTQIKIAGIKIARARFYRCA